MGFRRRYILGLIIACLVSPSLSFGGNEKCIIHFEKFSRKYRSSDWEEDNRPTTRKNRSGGQSDIQQINAVVKSFEHRFARIPSRKDLPERIDLFREKLGRAIELEKRDFQEGEKRDLSLTEIKAIAETLFDEMAR